ncbi:MAG: murein L,D-transpeptidase catalytic domain family protein, partial [Thermomonas sp.]
MPVIDPRQHALQQLSALAPDADPGVIALALEARSCAVRNGEADADARLAVIDYSRPSSEQRLWVFDMIRDRLLYREFVAHGSGSGENIARHFSNSEGSFQTSLGLYRTAETYVGKNGYSLRMDGLDPGFNDNARQRAIVMHGAWYANPELIRSQGRLGRSQGCPALREQVARVVIDDLKQRNLIFAYAEDAAWLQRG